jgi:hypothetical protein
VLTLPAYKRKTLAMRHPGAGTESVVAHPCVHCARVAEERRVSRSRGRRSRSRVSGDGAAESLLVESKAEQDARLILEPHDPTTTVAESFDKSASSLGFAVKYLGTVISFTIWCWLSFFIAFALVVFLCAYPPFWTWFWDIREWWLGYIAYYAFFFIVIDTILINRVILNDQKLVRNAWLFEYWYGALEIFSGKSVSLVLASRTLHLTPTTTRSRSLFLLISASGVVLWLLSHPLPRTRGRLLSAARRRRRDAHGLRLARRRM